MSAEQWCVVTGSSSGIGKATALVLAEAGWNIAVHCRASVNAAQAVVDQVRSLGRKAEMFLADLGSTHECLGLVESVWKSVGPPSAWIHNAGADTLVGPNAQLDFSAKLDLLTRVDLIGTMVTCREVGRRLRAEGGGCIVTMGWDQAETGMDGDSGELFAAVKGGVMAFTRSLAKSLAPMVRVNNVAPGWIQTAWGEQASSYWQERVRSETPLQRWGTPNDVALAVSFLISDRASFLTGQTFRVNGGVTMS